MERERAIRHAPRTRQWTAMRVSWRNSAVATTALLVWLVPIVSAISVPTGKLTPITPARPTPPAVNPHAASNPAPVFEYTQEQPEPPPLDPSYVPVTYNYFDTLARHNVFYVPVRYRNFNAAPNSIDYQQPQKYNGHTLGKNIDYKPYKRHSTVPYFPARADSWGSQNNRYNPPQYQYTHQYNQQYNNNEVDGQYTVQTTQQQQYQTVSTTVSGGTPTSPTATQTLVDYTTGKGSYDVTGKGGSKSEYYSKNDWSKKTLYPKKVLDEGLTQRKYPSHKY